MAMVPETNTCGYACFSSFLEAKEWNFILGELQNN